MAALTLVPDAKRAFETNDKRLFVEQLIIRQTNLLLELVEDATITPTRRAAIVSYKNQLETLKATVRDFDKVDIPDRP